MERYQDKVVLITGAGDVAEAAAKRLLCEGAKVAFSDFSQEALDAAISGLKAEGWDGERLMGIKCDVRKYEECEAAANAVLARWGQIDTLVDVYKRQGRLPGGAAHDAEVARPRGTAL